MLAVGQFLTISTATPIRLQNFFINQSYIWDGFVHEFAPFQFSGTTQNITGDNSESNLLFPNLPFIVNQLAGNNGLRKIPVKLVSVWLDDDLQPVLNRQVTDYFIGQGSTLDSTTVEVRLQSAVDAVTARFPSRYLSQDIVGFLPINAQLSLI